MSDSDRPVDDTLSIEEELRDIDVLQPELRRHVVVIGAGVSGLSAALELLDGAWKRGLDLDVTVLEASMRAGGVLETVQRQGFLIERGPDCFLSSKPAGLAMARRLGLEDRLVRTNPHKRRSFIVKEGRLHPVPEGYYLLAPTSAMSFLRTPLLSWRAKVRTALEAFLPPAPEPVDESLADFVRRRFGQEVLDRLAQPLIGGIYTADPERLSLGAAMPLFPMLERRYGSVIRGLWKQQQKTADAPTARASGARYSLFMSFDEGMGLLPRTMVTQLPPETVRFGCRVESLTETEPGSLRAWELRLAGGEVLTADGVCIAVPAPAAAQVLRVLDPFASDALRSIPYATSMTLNLAYREVDVPQGRLDGMGFVAPSREGLTLLAASFSSTKFLGRAPPGAVLIRTFLGGALSPDLQTLPQTEIVARVREDLQALLGIRSAPLFHELSRHFSAMPLYEVGHRDRVRALGRALAARPTIQLAGNAYCGVGVPDCIASGQAAARRLLASL